MISLGDGQYLVEQDKYQYILSTRYIGTKKVGDEVVEAEKYEKSFHATLKQVANAIADKEMKKHIDDLNYSFDEAVEKLTNAIWNMEVKHEGA